MGGTRNSVSPARVFARPTADQIWLGPTQRSALSQLSQPARVRLLAGPPSSGKTTLLGHLALQLAAHDVVLHCRGAQDTAASVLANLLLSAELTPWDLSEIEQRNLFTVFVQQRRSQGRRVVVVIDDVHSLKLEAWEELERLLSLSIDKQPGIELLGVAPSSAALSVAVSLGQVTRSECLVHSLAPPSREDVVGYVDWRLTRFDIGHAITPVAAQMIARLSGGRYSAVDVLCQMSLLLLKQLSLERADARVVRQAVATFVARQGAKLDSGPGPEAESPLRVPPQGYLLISRGGKVLNRVALSQRTLLGRSEHNDVCLASPYLSRHHAVIVGTPEGYYLVDLNSVNGVAVNGRRVERAVLCDQDVLAIGPFRLKIQIPEWLAHGSPFPEAEALADTAVMPPEPGSGLWRVK